jgi:hypothetical protein
VGLVLRLHVSVECGLSNCRRLAIQKLGHCWGRRGISFVLRSFRYFGL